MRLDGNIAYCVSHQLRGVPGIPSTWEDFPIGVGIFSRSDGNFFPPTWESFPMPVKMMGLQGADSKRNG